MLKIFSQIYQNHKRTRSELSYEYVSFISGISQNIIPLVFFQDVYRIILETGNIVGTYSDYIKFDQVFFSIL